MKDMKMKQKKKPLKEENDNLLDVDVDVVIEVMKIFQTEMKKIKLVNLVLSF